MKLVVLVFSASAIRISCMTNPLLQMDASWYTDTAIVLFLSSLFTFVSVSWNHFIDHNGQSTFEFPPQFPVTKATLISKHYTAVFPLGLLWAIMSFLEVICFLYEISYLELGSGEGQVWFLVADQEAWSDGSFISKFCQKTPKTHLLFWQNSHVVINSFWIKHQLYSLSLSNAISPSTCVNSSFFTCFHLLNSEAHDHVFRHCQDHCQ